MDPHSLRPPAIDQRGGEGGGPAAVEAGGGGVAESQLSETRDLSIYFAMTMLLIGVR